MLSISESDVRRLLPMAKAIELMREAFAGLASGDSLNQPRRRLILPTGSVLHYMAAAHGPYFGTKIYSTNPRSGAHFTFLLYAAQDGRPLATFEANHLGQIRTGAASAFATSVMAPADAATLGIIGSGFQARTQVEAIAAVRTLREVKVWSRSSEKRSAFAAACTRDLGLRVVAAETAREAAGDAAIICTATNAKDPVLEADWISSSVHINAMGSNQPQRRELPSELISRAKLIVVDSLEQARMESGDLLIPLGSSQWPASVVELKDVIANPPPDGITIFKSNGLAVEDVICAGYVYEAVLREKSYS